MKRMLLTAAASSLIALAAPAVASAHKPSCHHHHHGCAKHHARGSRVVRFGSLTSQTSSTRPTSPSTPTSTPTPPTPEPAGTIESFNKETGELTIKLKDGSTVTGKVTESTEIRCLPASSTESSDPDSRGDEESGTEGDSREQHSGPGTSSSGDDISGGEGGDDISGGEGDDEGGQASSCGTEALTPGTTVAEAELRIGPSGDVWESVTLVK